LAAVSPEKGVKIDVLPQNSTGPKPNACLGNFIALLLKQGQEEETNGDFILYDEKTRLGKLPTLFIIDTSLATPFVALLYCGRCGVIPRLSGLRFILVVRVFASVCDEALERAFSEQKNLRPSGQKPFVVAIVTENAFLR
jgi:hypothetical protein